VEILSLRHQIGVLQRSTKEIAEVDHSGSRPLWRICATDLPGSTPTPERLTIQLRLAEFVHGVAKSEKLMNFNFKVLMWPMLPLALALGIQAQTKLAIVNMNGALIGTREGHQAVSDLNAKQVAKSKEFEQKQNEILGLQDQLNKGANTLSEAAKNALFASIAARKKTVQREMEDAQADLQSDEQTILQQLGEKILAVVQRYAHDNGYTMVVDAGANTSPVLYAASSIDITKQIIELYDKSTAAPSTTAKPPAK
jgi:outer membrane protein